MEKLIDENYKWLAVEVLSEIFIEFRNKNNQLRKQKILEDFFDKIESDLQTFILNLAGLPADVGWRFTSAVQTEKERKIIETSPSCFSRDWFYDFMYEVKSGSRVVKELKGMAKWCVKNKKGCIPRLTDGINEKDADGKDNFLFYFGTVYGLGQGVKEWTVDEKVEKVIKKYFTSAEQVKG